MVNNLRKIVSVITINLNNHKGLEKTVESVKQQTNIAAEHIIIDGGSVDGSLDFIKNNKSFFSYWVSEPDQGVYHAQNKGIEKATGDYVLFLNSGDTLCTTNVITDFIVFSETTNSKVIYGNSYIIKKNNTIEKLTPPHTLTTNFWYRNTLNHQAVFLKKELFTQYGLYNTLYRFCADFDFFLNVFKNEPQTFAYFNTFVCNYAEIGLSAMPTNYQTIIQEKEKILKTYLTPKEYSIAKNQYLKQLPFKTQLLLFISEKPVLKNILNKLYSKK